MMSGVQVSGRTGDGEVDISYPLVGCSTAVLPSRVASLASALMRV